MKNPVLWTLLFFCSSALAQSSGGNYTLERHTIDGGGGTSQGGNYTLTGTIGQPDAGRLEGGAYVLQGGFWFDTAGQTADFLFADSFERP